MLLCDTDHGLVHDQDLVLSRRNGTLIVTTPDGRRSWGTADAAFSTGLSGVHPDRPADLAGAAGPFVGVHPIDTVIGRRPTAAPPLPGTAELLVPRGRLLRRRPSRPRDPGVSRRGERRKAALGGHPGRAGHPPDRGPGHHRAFGPASAVRPAHESARLSHVLFPDGEPALADSLQERYDRMDLRYAVGVLMGNRDLARRLAAAAEAPATG
jgi:hypothetical protein